MSSPRYERYKPSPSSVLKAMSARKPNDAVVQAAANQLRQLSHLLEDMSEADVKRLHHTTPPEFLHTLQPIAPKLCLPQLRASQRQETPRKMLTPTRRPLPSRRLPPAPVGSSPTSASESDGGCYRHSRTTPAFSPRLLSRLSEIAEGCPTSLHDAQSPRTLLETPSPLSPSPGTSSQEVSLGGEEKAQPAPALILRKQPIEVLVERRQQALDGLQSLLHSLNRVRHVSLKLPPHVAAAYRERLRHAIGWYRVTATELIERIQWFREQALIARCQLPC